MSLPSKAKNLQFRLFSVLLSSKSATICNRSKSTVIDLPYHPSTSKSTNSTNTTNKSNKEYSSSTVVYSTTHWPSSKIWLLLSSLPKSSYGINKQLLPKASAITCTSNNSIPTTSMLSNSMRAGNRQWILWIWLPLAYRLLDISWKVWLRNWSKFKLKRWRICSAARWSIPTLHKTKKEISWSLRVFIAPTAHIWKLN